MESKVDAIRNMTVPTTRKMLCRFIGMINYYQDMWKQRSGLLAPLTELTSHKVPWKWESRHQKAFDAVKRAILRETILAYPNFSSPFDIHTEASDLQIGAVISQNHKPIAFYSKNKCRI